MATSRYYDEEKNPTGAHFGGVPLTDLTEEEFDALPKHVQKDVDASPFYRKPKAKTKAPKKKAARAAKSRKAVEAAGKGIVTGTVAGLNDGAIIKSEPTPEPAPEGEEE